MDAVAYARGALRAHVDWLVTPHDTWREVETLLVPWGVQFVFSWLAFLTYMALDYQHHSRRTIATAKLPTRHPLRPFWWSQLRMVPLVLFNQLVVWPSVSFGVIWPIWARTNTSTPDAPLGGWPLLTLVPCFLGAMLAADQMWYWCHRALHVRSVLGARPWNDCHRDHHLAEQCALSATFVHPLEYALFTTSMQIFFALAGLPMYLHAIPLGWGMFTGSGAHSGYSGTLANGDEHNAHHLFHNVNFGLLMVADRMWGTHWAPTDPLPAMWSEAADIAVSHPEVHGTFEASTYRVAAAAAAAAAASAAAGAKAAGAAAPAPAAAIGGVAGEKAGGGRGGAAPARRRKEAAATAPAPPRRPAAGAAGTAAARRR